jgi:hypothetical protein
LQAGCATSPNNGHDVPQEACPPGRTLICTQRLGRQETCSCELEEGFEDIFEPMKR